MQPSTIRLLASALLIQVASLGALHARAQAPNAAMAPVPQYLIPSASAEVALARSAAPASISSAAEVLVLKRDGYTTAAKGTNGWVCLVERSFAAATDDPVFWTPRSAAPSVSIRRPPVPICPAYS